MLTAYTVPIHYTTCCTWAIPLENTLKLTTEIMYIQVT